MKPAFHKLNGHYLIAVLLMLVCSAAPAKKLKAPAAVVNQYLPLKELAALKKKPCAFFHAWATWCSICMEEMPDLVKILKAESKVLPVIIDVSAPQVQDSFSKKWMLGLRPGFVTYLKPDLKDRDYLNAIDPSWSGALPFSALFHNGKLLKTWTGSTELKTLSGQFERLCPAR